MKRWNLKSKLLVALVPTLMVLAINGEAQGGVMVASELKSAEIFLGPVEGFPDFDWRGSSYFDRRPRSLGNPGTFDWLLFGTGMALMGVMGLRSRKGLLSDSWS